MVVEGPNRSRVYEFLWGVRRQPRPERRPGYIGAIILGGDGPRPWERSSAAGSAGGVGAGGSGVMGVLSIPKSSQNYPA